MLRRSLWLHHRLNDRGGNAHNFPFDTTTKIYRDTVYAVDSRHNGNPIHPERPTPASPITPKKELPSCPDIEGRRRVPRRSGLQLEILGLYRDLLRETCRMEDEQTRLNLRRFIRTEFEKNRGIPRQFVTRIEWQLHYGKNKLDEIRSMSRNTKFSLVS
ncbi:hypothetical protein TRVL_00672 [Trypanosoma vivax]|uniref:Complex 1 LYR protein domain-containing protein n=1 Tax=Trypanosoma vivax (strain Y486) TaxID=1055687 RepID=G0U450_TRYVY|nr:hypothetical protein TRVL_00672 [Trypanosoma vivax]CCC52212.1 conserved hypothetical protein [Trypanosoma vivax Y486]